MTDPDAAVGILLEEATDKTPYLVALSEYIRFTNEHLQDLQAVLDDESEQLSEVCNDLPRPGEKEELPAEKRH